MDTADDARPGRARRLAVRNPRVNSPARPINRRRPEYQRIPRPCLNPLFFPNSCFGLRGGRVNRGAFVHRRMGAVNARRGNIDESLWLQSRDGAQHRLGFGFRKRWNRMHQHCGFRHVPKPQPDTCQIRRPLRSSGYGKGRHPAQQQPTREPPRRVSQAQQYNGRSVRPCAVW